ncbi:hypothetical protein DFH09DRAFT_1336368 [Mycena vulgaris]|nr:hypothetical protein DFH09DRAFT_1336368 [Mycena vulgaris]
MDLKGDAKFRIRKMQPPPILRCQLSRIVPTYRHCLTVGAPPREIARGFRSKAYSVPRRQQPKGLPESAPSRHSSVYTGWHTDAALPFPWSTDWANWEGLYLFEERVEGKLKIEKVSTEVFNIPGTVQPVAYMVETGIDVWAFTAGGRYYLCDDFVMFVDKGEFASPKEYLALLLKGGMSPTRIRRRPEAKEEPMRWLDKD